MGNEDGEILLVKTILSKLYTQNCFGKRHILLDRFKRLPIPPYAKSKLKVEDVIKDLNRKELILGKKTSHGQAIYLNLKKLAEIEKLIHS